MILAHHPLTMEGRFTDRLDSYHEVLSLLFRADVPLYSAHTSLDANPLGPVSWLADELGLCRIPSSDTKDGEAGHGMPLPLTVLEQTGQWSGAAVHMPAASASSAIVRLT
mgnify:FL=1